MARRVQRKALLQTGWTAHEVTACAQQSKPQKSALKQGEHVMPEELRMRTDAGGAQILHFTQEPCLARRKGQKQKKGFC